MFTKRKKTLREIVQVELLGFQNLQNSTILIEKKIVFTIVGVLLYHAIPSSELKILYNEAKSLEQMQMIVNGRINNVHVGWRKNMYK